MLEEVTDILTSSNVGKDCGCMSAFLAFVLCHGYMSRQSERARCLSVAGWHHPYVSLLMIPSIINAILKFVSLKETSTLYIEICHVLSDFGDSILVDALFCCGKLVVVYHVEVMGDIVNTITMVINRRIFSTTSKIMGRFRCLHRKKKKGKSFFSHAPFTGYLGRQEVRANSHWYHYQQVVNWHWR